MNRPPPGSLVMAQSTASTSSLSTLLVARMRPLCRSATRQERVGVRLLTLTLGLVMVSGRSMLTRVLMALGLGWRDWSAPYRLFRHTRLELDVLRGGAVRAWLALYPEAGTVVVDLDGTYLARTSKRLTGGGV